MSREEYEALTEVLWRRLHNTRDPELQALLWQLAEISDLASANWVAAHRGMRSIAAAVDAYQKQLRSNQWLQQ